MIYHAIFEDRKADFLRLFGLHCGERPETVELMVLVYLNAAKPVAGLIEGEKIPQLPIVCFRSIEVLGALVATHPSQVVQARQADMAGRKAVTALLGKEQE